MIVLSRKAGDDLSQWIDRIGNDNPVAAQGFLFPSYLTRPSLSLSCRQETGCVISLCKVYRQMRQTQQISKPDAIRAARDVANFLRSLGARRVVLFGSLLSDSYLPGSSDIDIFFEGIPRGEESFVAGKVLLEFPELPLELRSPAFCEEGFRAHILKYGCVI